MLMSSSTQTPALARSHALSWQTGGALVLAALLIALLSTASRVQTSADASFSLFWPSAGLGVVLLARYGLWGLASAALGVGIWALWVMQWSLAAALCAGASSAAGPALTWYLVRKRFAKLPFPFSRNDTLLAFMRAQALGGSVLAALMGCAGLWLTGHWPEGVGLVAGGVAYWMIETAGAFLFAPVAWSVLNPSGSVAASRWHLRFAEVVRKEWRSGLVVSMLTAGVLALLIGGQADYARALLYGLLPLLVVVSLRASPTLVHVLILATGVLVLMTVAYLQTASPTSADGTQLLLVALYLLVGTATLQVLLATSSEKRQALERLERQAFVDAQTRLLNEAGLVRDLEQQMLSQANVQGMHQLALIGLTLSNARQAASLANAPALLKLDRQMADQLRLAVAEVRWARVGAGRFQGVWVGPEAMLQPILSRVRLLTIPLASANLPPQTAERAFQPEWAVAAVQREVKDAQDFSIPSMLSALTQAEASAQQFRRVELVTVDSRYMLQLQQEAAMTEQVRRAIDKRALLLYAQPIAPNNTETWAQWQTGQPVVHKFEVLVRLADAQGKPISPADFMPAAMRAGLMPQLDLAVLEQTFAWLAGHPDALKQIHGCAVNLSGPTVGDARTVEFVRTLFERYCVPAEIMIFEITESMAVANPEVATHTLKALRAMGSRVAIDDFGTGMATFDYLKRFEVDFIKIDGTFIRALQSGDLDRVIVQSMVNVAQCLGVRTVAEFVSSAELYAMVSELAIDESQGYALSTPQPIDHWFPPTL
jgi:EAL domain-containing protein (putative c-di-GMP-specific phosphodiesterase class I)